MTQVAEILRNVTINALSDRRPLSEKLRDAVPFYGLEAFYRDDGVVRAFREGLQPTGPLRQRERRESNGEEPGAGDPTMPPGSVAGL